VFVETLRVLHYRSRGARSSGPGSPTLVMPVWRPQIAPDLRLVISKGSSSHQFPGGVSSYLTPIRVSLNCYPVISTFPAILGHPIKSKANRRLLRSTDWNIDKMKSENGGR
jgi:hypothetical protein